MKLIISNIDHFKWNFRSNDLNPVFVTEENIKQLNDLFEILRNNYTNISEHNDEERYLLYFRAPKGKYVDDEEYKECLKFGEEKTADQIKKYWDSSYPEKHKWFKLFFVHGFYRGINYYSFYLDNKRIFCVSDEGFRPMNTHYSQLISVPTRIVNKHIKLNVENKFQNSFDKTFGYGKRLGIIQYKDAWKIYPSLKRNYLRNFKTIDLNKVFQAMESEEITHFTRFRAKQYFDICKIGYLAVYENIDESIDSKELFYMKADGRTQGLEDVDIDDPDKFDEWYKENERWFDHTFEIFRGRSFYRGDLYIKKDENGYFLSLTGSNYHTEISVLKFYNALLNNGIKVKVHHAKLYKSRIDGTATFAIESEDNWCYGYTTVFGKDYIDSIHIEDFPKLTPYVKWEDVLMSKFIGGGEKK